MFLSITPNFPLFEKSGGEKKKEERQLQNEELCFSSKRKKIYGIKIFDSKL